LILTYPNGPEAETSLEGKFLQLTLAGREYLLFAAPRELRYHNQILGRFLLVHGIPHRWVGVENLIVDHPALAIIGGGRFRMDPVEKTLHVWDASSVYGRFDAVALSAQLAAAGPPRQELAVSVG